jgi:Lipocalin-like domain
MISRAALQVITLALMSACLRAQTQETNDRKRLIGTWELVATVEHMKDGSSRPYQEVGPKGKGYLIYTADGHMCAAGMNPDRPAQKNADKPTDSEKLRAFEGYFSYCGRFQVDTTSQIIYHYPEVALDPNLVGTKQKRPYKFEGDVITFSDHDNTPGIESYAISWRKTPPK